MDIASLDSGAYSSLHTEGAYDLDIRTVKARTAKELAKEIEALVKDTQAVVVRSYPNRIVMSPKQYDLLSDGPSFMQIGDVGQEFWLYRTKYNVMEVIVQ